MSQSRHLHLYHAIKYHIIYKSMEIIQARTPKRIKKAIKGKLRLNMALNQLLTQKEIPFSIRLEKNSCTSQHILDTKL